LHPGIIVAEGGRLKWYGVGRCSGYHMNDKDYLIFHGYGAKDEGRTKLIIKEIRWYKDNWPLIDNKESL
jgi:arabinan endo-1,5-alpha-L-arabinosidase